MSFGAATIEQEAEASEELRLWRAFSNGSAESREKLFELHLPFARRIAWRSYRQRNRGDMELAELYQLACVGLLEAIDRFDIERGIPFRGYAARRIHGSLADGIARMSEVREQLSFRARVQRERVASLIKGDIAQGSAEEALAALAELATGLAVGFMLEDTQLWLGEDERDRSPSPYEGLAFRRMVDRMHSEIGRLGDRERAILHYHYDEGLLFQQIASLLGISKGRVSQLHRAALMLLRKRLKSSTEFKVEG